MKLLKSDRELTEYDFRKNGHNKLELTLLGPDEKSEGIRIETGPQGARQKFVIPMKRNKTLIETINDNNEVVENSVLLVEYLGENAEGEGAFEIHLDEEKSPSVAAV